MKGIITITAGPATADEAVRQSQERNKGAILENCAPSTDCINEINNAPVDWKKGQDVVMPMYNLIEYSNSYSKISRNLW